MASVIMMNVIYAECHLASIANKPIILSVVMLNVMTPLISVALCVSLTQDRALAANTRLGCKCFIISKFTDNKIL